MRHRWRKRLARFTVLLVLAAVGVGIVGALVLDPNRHRARIQEFLLNRTGLAIQLGRIEWGVWPALNATIDEVQVSSDSWRAEIRDVSMSGNFASLLDRRINLGRIEAGSVILDMPDAPGAWLDVYRDIADGIRPKGGGRMGFAAESIGPIVVDYIELHSNDFDGPIVAANVSVSDVMASEIAIAVSGTSPAGGPASRFDAAVTLRRERGAGLTAVSGSAAAAEVDLHGLFPEFPPTLVSLNLETTSEDPQKIGVAVEGTTRDEIHPALNGVVAAQFWYTPEAVSLNDLRYEAPGASLRADATRHRSGEVAVELSEATLMNDALAAFLEQARSESVYLSAEGEAHVRVLDALFGVRADGTEEFTRGTLDFGGLSIRDSSGHAYESELKGRGVMKGRHITMESIEGAHSNFRGFLEPDFEAATVRYGASGSVVLSAAMLPERIAERYLPVAELPVQIGSLEGVYVRGDRPGRSLRFDATVGPGSARLTVGKVDAAITAHGGTLHFGDGVLDIGLDLEAEEFGRIGAAGEYEIEDRGIEGVIDLNVPQALPNIIKGTGPDSMYAPILGQFGRTSVSLSTVVPRSSYDAVSIEFAHESLPVTNGTIEFTRAKEGGLILGDMAVEGTIEAVSLDPRMTGPFLVNGPLAVTFTRRADEELFEVMVDGVGATVGFGRHIEKRPGDPLTIEVSGSAPKSGWSARRLVATCLGQRVPMQFVPGGLACEPARLDLAQMTRLAPADGYLAGSATLGFDTSLDQFEFGFENASFSFGEDLSLEALDGHVRTEAGRLGESELRLRNAAGDCRAAWQPVNDEWRGTIEGAFLDVDVLQRIVDAIGRASGNEPANPGAAPPGGPARYPLDGAIEIRLDRIRYRKALFTGLEAAGSGTPEAIRLPHIRASAYGGDIAGEAVFLAGTPGRMTLALRFSDVDTGLLDDLYFDGKRKFAGAGSGRLNFEAPMGPIKSMLAAGSGDGSIAAVNGTFGTAGWATRLLTVLKTAEIFAFRMPSLKDQGLTYDTCNAEFAMVQGRVQLSNTSLVAPAHRMTATGYLDFGADQTDVDVNVYLLQAINRITDHIPLIRNVADLTTGRIAVRVDVTGPPADLQFAIPADAGILQNMVGIGQQDESP